MHKKVQGLALAAFAAISMAVTTSVQAQYPQNPVTIVVAFAPGGGNDTVARIFAEQLSERAGQQFLVENLPGANGSVGTANVAAASPDGYRLVVGSPGTLVQNPYMNPVGYTLEDFTPIARFAAFDFVIVARSELGVETLDELIAYSTENPGVLNYGSPGIGNTAHQAGELIKLRTGADIAHIPYQGGAPALSAFLSGEVDVLFNVVNEVQPYIDSGDAVPLAVMSNERLPQLPDVPTVTELGLEDATVSAWTGLFAPAGIPAEVAEYLNAEITEILMDEQVVARLSDLGLRPQPGSSEELAAELEADAPMLRELIDLVGGPQ